MTRPIRICIDARLEDGLSGGVQQIVIGLASALAREGDAEEYFFLAYESAHDWLAPYLGGASRLLEVSAPAPPRRKQSALKAGARVVERLSPATVEWISQRSVDVPVSDGTIERAGVDVMHFPAQAAFLTEVPSIYQPHDLQHLHFPERFSVPLRVKRERTYREFCRQAAAVVLMTNWGRTDLIAHYQLSPEKVYVVPGGAVLTSYPEPSDDDLAALRARLDLPDAFLLYPAQTWPHKNHLRLLEAIARAQKEIGMEIGLVCTGTRTSHFREISKLMRALRLERIVFTGFVSPIEMKALYRLARGLVFPSLFEGWGLPVTEAFASGVPVACSSLPVLLEQARDAALYFPPGDVDKLATGLAEFWTDQRLRKTLSERGSRRAMSLTWEESARLFRAHYRRIAGAGFDGRARSAAHTGQHRNE